MSGAPPIDARAEMLSGAVSLATAAAPSTTRGMTSDLSIDEALLLHGSGWEPVDLVCGVSVVSVPIGVWNWGQGEITVASVAHNAAVKGASDHLQNECIKVHGHGVVGVRVNVEVHTHHIDVELVGTAIRPLAGGAHPRLRSCPTSRLVTSPFSRARDGRPWASPSAQVSRTPRGVRRGMR